MTTAAVAAMVLAALTGTVAWHRRLPLRTRTVLVVATGLLLLGAFLVAAAAAEPAVAEPPAPHAPVTVRQALAWLLVGWLSAAGGGPLAEVVLRLASGRLFLRALRDGSWRPVPAGAGGQDEPAVDEALEASQDAAKQHLRGGAMIGVLERLAVAGALLAGAAEGLALVVAVKALGRYPELRSAGASERFIIGTLASLLWAAAAAGTGRLLLV